MIEAKSGSPLAATEKDQEAIDTANPSKRQQTFIVEEANPFLSDTDRQKTVSVSVIDVLYNNELCSLVYMQDLTQFTKENEHQKVQEVIQTASTCINEELQAP